MAGAEGGAAPMKMVHVSGEPTCVAVPAQPMPGWGWSARARCGALGDQRVSGLAGRMVGRDASLQQVHQQVASLYRATRSMYVTCAPPDLSRSTVLLHGDYLGSRHLDPRVDSVLVFADGDQTTSEDDRWLHADLRRVDEGYRCPDGGAGVQIHIKGLSRRDLELVQRRQRCKN